MKSKYAMPFIHKHTNKRIRNHSKSEFQKFKTKSRNVREIVGKLPARIPCKLICEHTGMMTEINTRMGVGAPPPPRQENPRTATRRGSLGAW